MARCSTIKPNGTRCGGQAMRESEWCFSHHPEHAEGRRQRASKGGNRAGRGRPLLEVHDIAAQLQALVDKVLAGDLARADAAVIGQLLNYKRAVIATALTVRQQEEMEARLEELEAILEQRKAGA
jgi:hypothetical protein